MGRRGRGSREKGLSGVAGPVGGRKPGERERSEEKGGEEEEAKQADELGRLQGEACPAEEEIEGGGEKEENGQK